jgi:hypothetical protein
MTSIPSRPRDQVRREETRRGKHGRRRTTVAALVVTAIAAVPAVATPASGTKVAFPAKSRTAAALTRQAATPPALPKRCTELGIYRDDPVSAFPSLVKSLGPNVTTVSTYVTAGNGLDPKLVALARTRGLRLLVTWMPDDGTDETYLPGYSLANITGGVLDKDLRALAGEMKAAGVPVLFRPMPEPNTPWYAWSGTMNGNSPAEYVLAWNHVRKVVRQVAGFKVNFLWSPYVRSVPDSDANAIKQYFPGAKNVDLVGASGYNFGATGSLAWADPKALFLPAYTTIQGLAAKPFWITETGSTAAGGSQTAWIASLRTLKASMPQLRGVVWFDIADPQGDFRLNGPALKTTRSLLKGRCIV